ncbi:MAG: hypothetical protein ACR2IS_10060 [Nitrososphaeraceae archaeon]
MPNITTRLGQSCTIHGYEHEEEYLVCDFCNEHKSFICSKVRYYNYGFSRRSYLACSECHNTLFGQFRLVHGGIMERAYEDIIEVIKDKTDKKKGKEIDYYEAVKIAITKSEHMQMHFGSEIKDITEINKGFKPLWGFTYRVLNEERKRVEVVNKDPNNLLVSWIPGGMTLQEKLKASNMI